MKCWAKNVSECCDTQSREHYISKGLFSGKKLNVEGFPFLNGEKKEISKASLTKKCLCSKHNSLLSPFDSESIKFGKALEYAHNLSLKRRNSPDKSFSLHRQIVNAELFSRWVMKTYIGMLDFFPVESAIQVDELANMIFSNKSVRKYVDYKISMNQGDDFQIAETVGVAPLLRDDRIFGLAVDIYGINIHTLFHKAPVATSKLPKIRFCEDPQGLSCLVSLK